MRLNEHTKLIGKSVILIPYERNHVEKYHKWMQSKELQELTASMPLSLEEEYDMQQSWRNDEDKCTFLILDRLSYEQHNDECKSLIGDVNLFLSTDNDELCGEIEIMIAEPSARGKGCGWEGALLMMSYGEHNLHIKKFIAKIGVDNEKSLKMFSKIGFRLESESEIFREKTMKLCVDEKWLDWLNSEVCLKCELYE